MDIENRTEAEGGASSSVGIATELRAGRSGDRINSLSVGFCFKSDLTECD